MFVFTFQVAHGSQDMSVSEPFTQENQDMSVVEGTAEEAGASGANMSICDENKNEAGPSGLTGNAFDLGTAVDEEFEKMLANITVVNEGETLKYGEQMDGHVAGPSNLKDTYDKVLCLFCN